MMTRKSILIGMTAVSLTAVLFCTEAKAVIVDATDISGRSYGESVLKELEAAKEEIYVAMYSMYVRYGEEDNPAYKLADALMKARERGVYVRVYLDKSALSGNNTKRLNKGNDDAYRMLKEAGVEVYFIRPELKLHEKLIVIDAETVIDGSANWTQKALLENEESAQILRGKEFAQIKLRQMGELEKYTASSSAPVKRELLEKVRIRNSFLEDKRFAPRMVTDSDGHSFDLYLTLLREFSKNRKAVIGIDRAAGGTTRWVVNNLKEKYGLIDHRIDKRGNPEVILLDPENPQKEYSTPESGYFNVPTAYWEYGLDKQLMLREKFAYMVSIYEQEIAKPKLWWQKSLKGLSEKYHIDEWTFAYGLRQIKKLDLIEVRHSRVNAAEGESYADREPNEYRLKELISPGEKEKMWKNLEGSFGAEKTLMARGFAEAIDEGNNIQAVKDFIRIMERYGAENVKEAVAVVAKFEAGNPLRSINYIVGVLKRMERCPSRTFLKSSSRCLYY